MYRGAWWLVGGMVFVCGCGAWTLRRSGAQEEAPPPRQPQPYVWQEEGHFPAAPAVPAEPAGAALQESTLASDGQPGAEARPLEDPSGFRVESLPAVEVTAHDAMPPTPEAAAFDGYRVQAFATRSRETAERLRDELSLSFGVPVALDFEDPYFKIRVGACRDEGECRLLREQVRHAGYAAAFVVPARIATP